MAVVPGQYNVAYEHPDGVTCHYLGMNVSKKDAKKYMQIFRDRYENKPYPNGKGFYNFRNIRVVKVREA